MFFGHTILSSKPSTSLQILYSLLYPLLTILYSSFWMYLSFVAEIWRCLFLNSFFSHLQHLFFQFLFCVYERHILCIYTNLFGSFLRFSLMYKQKGGGAYIGSGASGTFISCLWSGNTAPTDNVSTIVSILLLSPSLDQSFIRTK